MKSPFPGMDPYLERHWGDAHQALIVYARDALQPRLPEDLQALIDQVYAAGRYHKLDYRPLPDPPLSSKDAVWADALLKAAGKR